jgi:hypothetical protein
VIKVSICSSISTPSATTSKPKSLANLKMALAIFHDSILEKERARDATKRQEDEAKDQERAAMLTSAANKKAASAQKKEPG